MKNKIILTLAIIAAFACTLTSCKKENNPNSSVVKINALNNGKTVNLLNGQKLQVSLGNPGDGGYTFDPPKYDSTLLKLNSHTNIPPKDKMVVGDFGTDVWEFGALRSGSAGLTITATRGTESPVTEFTGTIAVK
jgi:predicted secreted protein